MVYRLEGAELILSSRSLVVANRPQPVRPKIFEILVYLVENRDRLVPKEELLGAIWRGVAVTDDSLVQAITELRRVLGDDARHPRYIRTLTRVGYQFVGRVEIEEPGVVDLPACTQDEITTLRIEVEEQETPALGPPVQRKRWIAAAISGVAVAVLGFLLLRGPKLSTTLPEIAGNHPVLVLYFENQSHIPELDWLREGLADMVIADLSRSPRINVLSRQQVEELVARGGRDARDPLPLKEVIQMAGRARAQAVLLGTFVKLGDNIRITVQVHRAADGSFLKSETAVAGRPDQIITQMGTLSTRLLRDLGVDALKHADAASLPITNNLEAYRLYSLGVERINVLETKEGVQLLERAVGLDPQFAVAWAALGDAYVISEGQPEPAKLNYEKAFQLSDRLTERDRLNISAGYALANLDYPEAIQAYRRIIARYPDAEAYYRLSRLLYGEARYAEALDTVQQGLTVDPDEPSLYNTGALYCELGRCGEGVAASKRYVELSGSEANAWDSLGTAYAWTGRYDEAEQAYADAIRRKPDFFIPAYHQAILHYWQGRYTTAMAECERLASAEVSEVERNRALDLVAWIYRQRGDQIRARMEIGRIKMPSMAAILLAVDHGDLTTAEQIDASPLASTGRGMRSFLRYHWFALAQIALARGQNDQAIDALRELLRLPEPIGSFEWFDDSLGDAFLRLGRLDEAIAEYQRVLSINPNYAKARFHLAVAYGRKGDRDRSRAEYRNFLETWKHADADIPEVRQARAAVE